MIVGNQVSVTILFRFVQYLMLFILVLLAVSLQHIAINATNILYVSTTDNDDTQTLEYYLNNHKKYFKPDTKLQFKPGKYNLNVDLVVQNVTNFSMVGEYSCKIICFSLVNIKIFRVKNFTLENINFENCNKNDSNELHTTFDYDYVSISKPSRNASILLYNCTSVVINNINVLVNAGTTGILVVNVRGNSTLTDVSITVNYTICPTEYEHPEQINGLVFYYDHYDNKTTNMQLERFQFTTSKSCAHPLQYAITLLLFQNSTNVSFTINNTKFNNLINVSLLYYYGETCGSFVKNSLTFTNNAIFNNTGYSSVKTFEIILYNQGCFNTASLRQYCNQQYNSINFRNCVFINNHNITSMIHVTPASSRTITGYIYITNSSFCNNANTHFLILESETDNIWQLSNFVLINSTNISSNRHFQGKNLISATNCWLRLTGTTNIANNSLYKNIIKLHLSGIALQHNITITNNTARHIYDGSYILIIENTTLNMSFNTVYKVVRLPLTIGISTKTVCGAQFYSTRGNLDKVNEKEWSFKVIAQSNTHMTSKKLPGSSLWYTNCQWLAGTAFHTAKPTEVYKKVFRIHNLVIENNNKSRPIPLSVCKCTCYSSDVKSFDCYSPYLGSIFPGETLTAQLSVQKQWISLQNSSKAITVENSDQDDCSIVHASELSQTHFNGINYCNNYSYTLWPKNATIKECQLFIGLSNMQEMFYVQIKPCPKGFTFQKQRKACYCDPLLNNRILSITSCNIKDESILRPANSWIYAYTDENLLTKAYIVSPHCPFAYCLPQSSRLNLSNPDSQCQFNRTGVLCGKCKPGLSVVLGTSQCKFCSNVYLLLLIPVAISGIVLVVALYVFDLTVRTATMNTLIFYINIININILTLFPGCQSTMCIVFSQLNFNFRTKTCFYNGMDQYFKECLNLLHPFYFISIAILFIVLSRYSSGIQRLTAQRALPVLATLILFSYTRILLSVCHVLFQYSTITHLPSNKTEMVWSISPTTPLFGWKFLALFIVCIIIFLILLPFNVILLFTRRLSQFKLVTKLKPLLDTYFSAYKDKAYYWTGLLLLTRVIIYTLSALQQDISFIAISILLAGLLCLHGIIQPFKSNFHNIQESVVIVNLLAAHVAPLYKNNQIGLKVAQILLTVGVIYLILAIVISRCKRKFGKVILKCTTWFHCKFCKKKIQQNTSSMEMECLSNKIPDVAYVHNYQEFQEPLMEYEN